jgi:hypothetical protein
MSNDAVSAVELRALREDVSEIRVAVAKVADALERLARLEERQVAISGSLERAFTAIGKVETRLRENVEPRLGAIEQNMPVQQLTSRWVERGVVAAATVVLVYVAKAVGLL